MSDDADGIFERAVALRSELAAAEGVGDIDAADRLRAEVNAVQKEAATASIDVEAAGEELIAQRHALKKVVRGGMWAWFLRLSVRGGVGSPERMGTDTLPTSGRRHSEAERKRIVTRIYELEDQLSAVDAMGDIPLLSPDNVRKWW